MREVKRRTRVAGAFPDENLTLMFAAARLCHIAGPPPGIASISDYEIVN